VHPQLRPLPDGRETIAAPCRRPLRGLQSAGSEATYVRPEAIEVMVEFGVDISGQESETTDGYLAEPFDYVFTVCDDAKEACPVVPGAKNCLHWSFRDPS
jgi:arsenate reductase (thioredoxin)